MISARSVGPILLFVGVAVFSYMKSRPETAQDASYEILARPAFQVTLPKWEIAQNEGTAGLGRYKVMNKANTGSAEVSWQGGSPTLPEEMQAMVDAMSSAFEFELVEQSSEEGIAGQYRLNILGTIKEKVWLSMSIVECKTTQVLVTLGFSSTSRKETLFMSQKALKSFRCLGDSPSDFEGLRLVGTTLDDSFGQHIEGEALTLVNASGHQLLVFGGSESNIIAAKKYPAQVMKTYTELLEVSVSMDGDLREQSTSKGGEQWLASGHENDSKAILVMAGFRCSDLAQGYIAIAFSKAGDLNLEQLDGLLAQLHCPAAGDDIRKRKTACEVGAQNFCEGAPKAVPEAAPLAR